MNDDEIIYNLKEDNKKLKKEIKKIKLFYAKCRDCKHANLYIPAFAYPYVDPHCELRIKKITPYSDGCEDFELIGRGSR